MKLALSSQTSKILCGLILLAAGATKSFAADAAQGTFTSQSLGGGEFDYTLTLKNTGTNNLETFWFGWIPGEDFMPVSPTSIVSPTNWTANITHGGGTDGFAIQWVTSSAPLTPGSSFTFSFDSTMTPAVMAGTSPDFPSMPTGTSFVYSGGPFSDAGLQFTVTSAPEPSALALFAFSFLLFGGILAFRKGVKSANA